MDSSRHTRTRSLSLGSIYMGLCLFTGVWTQTPILNLGNFINGNCIVNSEDHVMLEGSVNMSGVLEDDWSNFVEFVIQDESSVLCQAVLVNCSSQSQLGCYCKESNGSFFTVVFNQTADIIHSGKMLHTRLATLDSVTIITSTETIYPTVSEIIDANLTYGTHSGSLPLNTSLLNIPLDNQEMHFAVSGLNEPFTITVTTPNTSIEFTNQSAVSVQVNESMGHILLSYEEHASCQRRRSYFYTLKDVWRPEPQLFLGNFSNISSCVLAGQDIGLLEATADFTGVDESRWFLLVSFVVANETIPACTAVLSTCPPDWYAQATCYCKERRGHAYSVVFNQTANLLFSEKEVRLRAFGFFGDNNYPLLESNESITYPYVNGPLAIILGYGNNAQYPPINNSFVFLPDDQHLLDFTVDRMRDPSSITYNLSSPDLGMTFVNQTTVNITVYDSTNYVIISYQEELYCQRGATYQFTLKAVTSLEPTLGISSVTTEHNCPMALEDVVTMEGVVDFTGVDYSDWILEVRFFTASDSSLCVVPLFDCGETSSTTCYCKGHQRDVYTIVFNDTAEPALSLQMIHLGMNRTNSSIIEAAEAVEYPFVGQVVNVTMTYGNETRSPPVNNSIIYIPDDDLVIQFTVEGMRNPSFVSYRLNSPDHGWTFANQSSVRIPVYDSTNYITISYDEEDFCPRSIGSTYHFTLKAVYRQNPVLSIGPVTSDKECVVNAESMVTFSAEVDFTGVDYSQWVLTLVFLSPASSFMMCAVSLGGGSCGETSRFSCYCESHVRDVYAIVFNATADITHSLQPVYLQASRTNFSTIRANETSDYPFVNREISVTMAFGDQKQSPPINNSLIFVPDDNQVITFTVDGMRNPSSIGYKLSSLDSESEFENQTSVNITVYDSTNYITIWYEEKDFCRRSATYSFTLKEVNRQEPSLSCAELSSTDECLVAEESLVTSECMVNFTGVDYSEWILLAQFFTPTINSTLCEVSLLECTDEQSTGCYCKGHTRDVYTVVFESTADFALSMQPVHLGLRRTNASTMAAVENKEYPFVEQTITVSMTYDNEIRSPPVNNSMIYIPDADPVIQLTVDGLHHPSYIGYNLSHEDIAQEFVNHSSINITVNNNTNYITLWFEETHFCQRGGIYHFPVKVVSKEAPALYLGSLAAHHPCVLHGEGLVTMEAIVDFTGVDDSKWIPVANFLIPTHQLTCAASLTDCSELQNTPCYCKEHAGDIFTLVFNQSADAALSLQTIILAVSRTNFSQNEANETQEYPLVSEKIQVNVTAGNQTRSAPFSNNKLFIPIEDRRVHLDFKGLIQPFSISYITSHMSQEITRFNQSSVVIPVNETTTFLNVSYAEDMYCERRDVYHILLKVVWKEEPQVMTGAITSNADSCAIRDRDLIRLEPTVNFTGVDDSQWLDSVDFVSPTSNGSNDVICKVSLIECQLPSTPKMCYCKDHTEEIYTVVFNHTADLARSESLIHLVAYKVDAPSMQASVALEYPLISDNIEVIFKYALQVPAPFVNNSVQEIHGDHESVQFTVNGLSLPFVIEYTTSDDSETGTSVGNESTVAIPVRETRITLTYEEKQHCLRKNTYILTMEDSSDGLSTAAIVAIVLGGLVFIVLLIALLTAIFNKNCWCKSRKRSRYATSERHAGYSNTTHL